MHVVSFNHISLRLLEQGMSAYLAPKEAAEVGACASRIVTAGGASEGAIAEFAQLIVMMSPSRCPKGDRLTWLQPMREADRSIHEMPFALLCIAKADPHSRDRYGILAEVYDLNADPGVALGVEPSCRDHPQFHPAPVYLSPEIDHAENRAQEGEGKGRSIHDHHLTMPFNGGQDR